MGKLVIEDTHHKDQDAKLPLHSLIKTVICQFVSADKHQWLFVCFTHGSLCIDEAFHSSFMQTRQVHYIGSISLGTNLLQ